jgi:hypothetical protein
MITVSPTEFTKVEYDAGRIAALAAEALAGVADVDDNSTLELHIAENEATSVMRIESIDPIVLRIDGGAIENYRDPRRLGDLETKIAVTRLLLELADRRNPEFGAPDLAVETSQAHRQAWDVNLYGRVARHGLRLHKPRFLYNFRNRHGFTDHADRIFEQLWSGEDLTWPTITELSDRAAKP